MAAERRPAPRVLPTLKDLPPDAQAHLAKHPPWLQEAAAGLFPTPEVESAAQRADEERASADRTAWFQTVRDLCQRAKRGEFGDACKQAVEMVLTDPDESYTAAMKAVDCEKIINDARKTQAIAARQAKRPPGRGAK